MVRNLIITISRISSKTTDSTCIDNTFFTLMTTTYQTNITDQTYNGWTNYETWNVSLWIQNDPGLYECAKHDCRHYQDVIDLMYGCGSTETPDGVKWDSDKINHIEINEMLQDL